MDGIGGQVKRKARLEALSGKTVHSVADFINVQSAQSVIRLFEITEKSIMEVTDLIDQRWKDVIALPETQKMHSVAVIGVNVVRYARYVNSEEWKLHEFKEHNDQALPDKVSINNLRIGDFVEVEYNGKSYPWEVKLVGKEDVQVSVLHRQFAQNWKWPKNPDVIFYKYCNVLRKLTTPEPVGTGDRLSFKLKEWD